MKYPIPEEEKKTKPTEPSEARTVEYPIPYDEMEQYLKAKDALKKSLSKSTKKEDEEDDDEQEEDSDES